MTRKAEINWVTNAYECACSMFDINDIKQAFRDGIQWADEHPDLSLLWHDASEIPDRQGNLLYILSQGGLHISNIPSALRTCKLDKVRWEEYAEELGVVKWAYISDLLPKNK